MSKKVNFVGAIVVKAANPNGDPLNGNVPRTTFSGLGEITDVCLKHKIRNRLHQMGENILVREADESAPTLEKRMAVNERFSQVKDNYGKKKASVFDVKKVACEEWFDVRLFGQVFALKAKEGATKGDSIAVRGPLQVFPCFSVEPVLIQSNQITKCISAEEKNADSDTMGMKHRVEYGIYVLKGQINGYIGEKTGLSEEDIEKTKEAILTMFENDESSARPSGSMYIDTLVWYEQDSETDNIHSANEFYDSVHIYQDVINENKMEYACRVEVSPVEGIVPEIIKG